MQLHMHRDVPDAWKDVGASGAASQGGASTTAVAVRTIDLAALVRRVSRWVKSRGGKLLAKLDIEGSEYTVAPHLALDGALCLIDTVMIEWHQRYYGHSNLFRVSKLLNLSARTSGYGVAISWTGGTPRALAAAAAACPTATVVSEIDGVTLTTKSTGDRLGEFDFVIDHENAHDAEPSAGTGFRSRSFARLSRQAHHHDGSRSRRAESQCEGLCRCACGQSWRSPAARTAPTCQRRPPTWRSTAPPRRRRVRRPSWHHRPDGRRPGP